MNWLIGLRDWVDARLPIVRAWDTHMAKYYAPKNFNLWFFFGVLSLLVLWRYIVRPNLEAQEREREAQRIERDRWLAELQAHREERREWHAATERLMREAADAFRVIKE